MHKLQILFAAFLTSIIAISPGGGAFADAISCEQILTGKSEADPVILPGSPADLQVIAQGGVVSVFSTGDLITTIGIEDTNALASTITDSLGNPGLLGQGVRIGFAGFTTPQAARLMRTLSFEGKKRGFGTQEGVVAASGGAIPPVKGNGTDVAVGGEPTDGRHGHGGGDGGGRRWYDRFSDALAGRGFKERYDFTAAKVTYAKGSSVPVVYDAGGAKFIQDFVVEVPAAASSFDFVVKVFYMSKRSTEVTPTPKDVITEALHQPKLSHATLRQAANEIIKATHDADVDWNTAIEGADVTLVELIVVPRSREGA